jgi:hypothetical protein
MKSISINDFTQILTERGFVINNDHSFLQHCSGIYQFTNKIYDFYDLVPCYRWSFIFCFSYDHLIEIDMISLM